MSSEEVEGLQNVSDLLDLDRMEWNVELIEEHFNERDQRCILAIPTSWQGQRDEITWAYSNDSNYSVKTAYMLGKGCNLDDFHQAFVDIWGMEANPKVRHFLWRVCTNTLSVKALLQSRHMVEDSTCPWCLV